MLRTAFNDGEPSLFLTGELPVNARQTKVKKKSLSCLRQAHQFRFFESKINVCASGEPFGISNRLYLPPDSFMAVLNFFVAGRSAISDGSIALCSYALCP